MLTEQMTQLISTYTIGCIATVRPDGAPAVSPKGTFLVIDDRTIAFGNIRSQATVENICRNPQVEVNFIDVFARKGCRVRGRGRYASLDGAQPDHRKRFQEKWPDLYDLIRGLVTIDVFEAKMLTSPSYDIGATESDLAEHWLRRDAKALGFTVIRQPGRVSGAQEEDVDTEGENRFRTFPAR